MNSRILKGVLFASGILVLFLFSELVFSETPGEGTSNEQSGVSDGLEEKVKAKAAEMESMRSSESSGKSSRDYKQIQLRQRQRGDRPSYPYYRERGSAGSPIIVAYRFLKENVEKFHLKSDLSDIDCETWDERPLLYRVQFKQKYNGIPVFKGPEQVAGVSVFLNKDMSLYKVDNQYIPGVNISTDPLIAEKKAVRLALGHFRRDYRYRGKKSHKLIPCGEGKLILKRPPGVQLVVLYHEGYTHLSYRVRLDVKLPCVGITDHWIDAGSGKALAWKSLVRF